MDLYRQKVLDHYRNPRNFGALRAATHRAELSNPMCGDEVEIALTVRQGKIQAVKFRGRGCAISMAATSLLTEAVSGKRLTQVRRMTAANALQLLGAPVGPARHKCALLGYEALQQSVI